MLLHPSGILPGADITTLILGPGGYRFEDYWRMGLPLEIIAIAVAIPMILWVRPLSVACPRRAQNRRS